MQTSARNIWKQKKTVLLIVKKNLNQQKKSAEDVKDKKVREKANRVIDFVEKDMPHRHNVP
ncbi:hypothetical protein BAIN110137_03085 [Bacillus inaquosorum]